MNPLLGISAPAALRMLAGLLGDAEGLRSNAWIASYQVARRLGRPKVLNLPDRLIRWRSVPATLSVGFEAGGLAAWHEIAHKQAYAPIPSLLPQPGWTVVDVGANIGTFSAWSAAQIGSGGFILAEESSTPGDRLRGSCARDRTRVRSRVPPAGRRSPGRGAEDPIVVPGYVVL